MMTLKRRKVLVVRGRRDPNDVPEKKMPIESLPDPDLGHPLEPEMLLIHNGDSILLDSL
jgi:hypothetical protein